MMQTKSILRAADLIEVGREVSAMLIQADHTILAVHSLPRLNVGDLKRPAQSRDRGQELPVHEMGNVTGWLLA